MNSYPSSAEFATTATEGQNSVDGDGNQRREVAGGKEHDPETEEAEQVMGGRRVLEKFPKFDP